MYVHAWMIYLRHIRLLVCQTEVFEYLVLQSTLLTANFRKSNRQKMVFFFPFSSLDFYGLIIVYT